MSSPQQPPYGGGWPGGEQPPTDPAQQYNVAPPGSGPGYGYDQTTPQSFEQAGYGQPDYSGQYQQPGYQQYDQGYGQQPYSAPPGYDQQQQPPYSGGPAYGAPGYQAPVSGFPGGPQPPKKTNMLPWILGGGGAVVLIIVIIVVIALVAMHKNNSGNTNNTANGSTTSSSPNPNSSPSGDNGSNGGTGSGTYQAADDLCKVVDTSPVTSLASSEDGSPSSSKSDYGEGATTETCQIDYEGGDYSSSNYNLVDVQVQATVYASAADASSAWSSNYDSAKSVYGGDGYEFKDLSGVGEKAWASYKGDTNSSYTSTTQYVAFLDGNATMQVTLIMTTQTDVSKDKAQQMGIDVGTKTLAKLSQ